MPRSNVSEASLQLKSNCGCLLIDDFGRQRIDPTDLLNRWIVPLECRHDFLTLATGKKIQVPFEQLIIFSTNLEPMDLADEAFLRRIPYKIEVKDPSVTEFARLFEAACRSFGCQFFPEAVHYLIETHYTPYGRPLRRCHPRDLLAQIKNYCVYYGRPMELRPDYLDRVVRSYFTALTAAADGGLIPSAPPTARARLRRATSRRKQLRIVTVSQDIRRQLRTAAGLPPDRAIGVGRLWRSVAGRCARRTDQGDQVRLRLARTRSGRRANCGRWSTFAACGIRSCFRSSESKWSTAGCSSSPSWPTSSSKIASTIAAEKGFAAFRATS